MYIGVSIYRIKKLINEKELKVNTKLMIIFAAAFGLSILSSIIYFIKLTLQGHTFHGNPLTVYNVSNKFIIYISFFFTQTLICYIFWNMDSIQFVPLPAEREVDEEIVTEDAHE